MQYRSQFISCLLSWLVVVAGSSVAADPLSVPETAPLPIARGVSPSELASGHVGAAYNQTLSASGGNGPYQYSVTAGSLPAGLNLSRNGKITGTPLARGQARFTITATDALQVAAARSYTMRIGAANAVSASTWIHPNATL